MKNAFYHGLKSTDLVLFVVTPSMDLLRGIRQQILLIIPIHHPHQIHHQDIIGHYQIYSISEEDRQVDMMAQVVEIQAHLHPLVAVLVVAAILTLGEDILCLLMRKILTKPPVLFHIPFFSYIQLGLSWGYLLGEAFFSLLSVRLV